MTGKTKFLSRGEAVVELPQAEKAAPRPNYAEMDLGELVTRTVEAEKALKTAERQLSYARDTLARRETELATSREEYDAVRAAIREAVAE